MTIDREKIADNKPVKNSKILRVAGWIFSGIMVIDMIIGGEFAWLALIIATIFGVGGIVAEEVERLAMTIDREALTPGKRFRHVKRGTVYEIIGTGELQMNCDLSDGSRMVVYRGNDGRIWCREEDEFLDGRFAALDQPAQPSIWLRFSGDGQHIRKWDFKPFDGGVAYGALPDESR